jgi:hypothetical protein
MSAFPHPGAISASIGGRGATLQIVGLTFIRLNVDDLNSVKDGIPLLFL